MSDADIRISIRANVEQAVAHYRNLAEQARLAAKAVGRTAAVASRSPHYSGRLQRSDHWRGGQGLWQMSDGPKPTKVVSADGYARASGIHGPVPSAVPRVATSDYWHGVVSSYAGYLSEHSEYPSQYKYGEVYRVWLDELGVTACQVYWEQDQRDIDIAIPLHPARNRSIEVIPRPPRRYATFTFAGAPPKTFDIPLRCGCDEAEVDFVALGQRMEAHVQAHNYPEIPIDNVLGWRQWKVGANLELRPLYQDNGDENPWNHGEWVTARCGNHRVGTRPDPHGHRAPGLGCDCGFNAYYEPEDVRMRGVAGKITVQGMVLGTGELVAQSDGFRSERAKPLGLLKEYEGDSLVAEANGISCLARCELEALGKEFGEFFPKEHIPPQRRVGMADLAHMWEDAPEPSPLAEGGTVRLSNWHFTIT